MCKRLCFAAACVLSLGLAIGQQPATAESTSGSGEQLEIQTFGKRLQPGDVIEKSGLHTFFLVTTTAAYATTGQHTEVLRLCRYRETAAADNEEQSRARSCQRSALTNLGRYSEAERLAFEDAKWVPSDGSASVEVAQTWAWSARINMNQGNMALSRAAFNRTIQLAGEALGQSSQSGKPNGELRQISQTLLADLIQDSRLGLVLLDFYDQNFSEFDRRTKEILQTQPQSPDDLNSWATDRAELAAKARAAGRPLDVGSFYRSALPIFKADAGFRDEAEPLMKFVVHPAISAVLGDERTQASYTVAWIRLAKAYHAVGRTVEGDALLVATHKLAQRFELEPAEANTLVAQVEEVQAQAAADRGQWPAAVELLRSARKRLLGASVAERSSAPGRRNAAIGSALLGVNAKLLGALAQVSATLTDAPAMDEALELIGDFSASRADINSQLAANASAARSAGESKLLEQEGRLVDELVELKAKLAGASLAGNGGASSQLHQERLARLYTELASLKSQLRTNGETGRGATGTKLRELLGEESAYLQWVFHPYGNFLVVVQDDAVRIVTIDTSLESIRRYAAIVGERSALRQVTSLAHIPPFPADESSRLSGALLGSLNLMSRRQNLILASTPVLDGIPWGALKLRSAGAEPWLIERHALSVTPSWRSWVQLTTRRPSGAKNELIAIGDPQTPPGPVTLADLNKRGAYIAAAASHASVTPRVLKTTFAAEMDQVATLFPAARTTQLRGPQATKQNLAATDLSTYKRLLFSTHGYVSGAVSATIGPALEMTSAPGDAAGRFLTASEISRWKLDADAVVLSACDTSASDGFEGSEGYSGLTSAFLLAGARSVLSTLWPVETEATRQIIVRTLAEARVSGTGFPRALRLAVLEYLKQSKGIEQHPYFWAGLVIVGK